MRLDTLVVVEDFHHFFQDCIPGFSSESFQGDVALVSRPGSCPSVGTHHPFSLQGHDVGDVRVPGGVAEVGRLRVLDDIAVSARNVMRHPLNPLQVGVVSVSMKMG